MFAAYSVGMFPGILQNIVRSIVGSAILIAGLGATTLVAAQTANARSDGYLQTHCMEQGYLLSYLNKAFGESQVASAESEDGHPVQLYASRKGSWTLVEIMPDGNGCVNAAGEHMHINAGPRPARKPAS